MDSDWSKQILSFWETAVRYPASSDKPKPKSRPRGRGLDVSDVFTILGQLSDELTHSLFGGYRRIPAPRHPPTAVLRAVSRVHTDDFHGALRAHFTAEPAGSAAAAASAPLDALAEYMPFADAAYCTKPPREVSGCEVVLCEMQSSPLGAPSFFIARNDESRRIVVAVRGTQTVEDALTDLVADATEFCGGVAHNGIAKATCALFEVLKPLLRVEMDKCDGYGVALAGHSLGGGVVALLTKLLLDDGSFGSDIIAVAIAPPPVFAPLEAMDERWSSALHCFVLADDIVPRMSMLGLRNFIVETLVIDFKDSAIDLEKVDVSELRYEHPNGGDPLPGSRTDDKDCEEKKDSAMWLRPIYKDDLGPKTPFSRLYVPARKGVHWLVDPSSLAEAGISKQVSRRAGEDAAADASSNDDGETSSGLIATVPASVFPLMLLTEKCVDNHMIDKYKEALAGIIGSSQ